MTDLPTPIHHRRAGRIDPAYAHKRGKQVLPCIDCGIDCMEDPQAGFTRCEHCQMKIDFAKLRKAP